MSANPEQLKNILEAALLTAGEPLSLDRLSALFPEEARPEPAEVRQALQALSEDCAARGIELKEVGSGLAMAVTARSGLLSAVCQSVMGIAH